MRLDSIDQLDELGDPQLWEVASDTYNEGEIRLEALQRWLYPDDDDPDELGGKRLRELRQLATVLEEDEIIDDEIQNDDEMAPYFDTEGRLILIHNGVTYLIDSDTDDGAYDGIDAKDDLYSTDDKTNVDRDI
ncbi:MAG: hypothetical protein KF716_20700 [Anaerolineae bacterium]|nr:hypothetical protein [Anaerolineae bacterium]